jgi:hypothetical protein
MDYPIEKLILAGAVEVAGIDSETGEFLYSFTDKVQEIMPQLYQRHLDLIHQEILYFWEHGFLNIDDFSKANPSISLTSLALNEEAIAKLPPKKIEVLNEIKRSLRML